MKIALQDLHLERLLVIYPGTQRYKIADHIEAVPFEEVVRGDGKSIIPQIGSPARDITPPLGSCCVKWEILPEGVLF